jgi:hypothetical protein
MISTDFSQIKHYSLRMEFSVKGRIKIQVIIAFLLWCYIIYRAFFISITQDEAHTYLLVKTYNWKQALTTTNTHWLNSFFIRIFLWLPGQGYLWKIRMLSILSWLVYSFSTIQLSRYFKSQWIGFNFFVVAILNPFLIFYFSLARGYAPACAFIMLSLCMAAKLIQANEIMPKKWFYVFLVASVATFANFSAFYFFIALMGSFLLQLLINRKLNVIFYSPARQWLALILGTSLLTFFALYLIKSINELYFPGKSNIVNSLFGSLIKSFSYFDDSLSAYYKGGVAYLLSEEIPEAYQHIGIVIAILLVVSIVYISNSFFQSKRLTLCSLSLFSCLAIVLFNVFFHIFFKTPYLFGRTTLIFYPSLVLGLFCFIDTIIQNSLWFRRTVNILLAFLLIVIGCNFYKSFSLNNFLEWPVQTNTKECLNYLQASNARMVGINGWHYSVFINYYSKAYPGKYRFNYQIISEKAQMDSLKTNLVSKFDYLLLAPPYNDSALLKGWSIKMSFPESGAKVLKKDSTNILR